MAQFTRNSSTSRFRFLGMKLNAQADALPEGKYPYAQNVRGYNEDGVTSRPQFQSFATAPAASPVLTYDPTLNLTKIATTLYIGTFAIDAGYSSGLGCSMVPFRPNESPQAWEYVFDASKQTKILPNPGVPASTVVKKVGIAEPQLSPDALTTVFQNHNIANIMGGAGNFSATGTAGGIAGATRSTETISSVQPDPLAVGLFYSQLTLQVGGTQEYYRNQYLRDTTRSADLQVSDVFPGSAQAIQIIGIFYFAGVAGHCVMVLNSAGAGPGTPGTELTQQELLSTLRRGAIVQIKTGGGAGVEVVYIWSVVLGPDNTVCIETSTLATIAVGYTVTALPAIQVLNILPVIGDTITALQVNFNVTAGVGMVKASLAAVGLSGTFFVTPGGFALRNDDVVHLSVLVDDPTRLTSLRVMLDVSTGSFDSQYYYYEVRASDLQSAITGAAGQATQLAVGQLLKQRSEIDRTIPVADGNVTFSSTGSQLAPAAPGTGAWTEIVIPINAFTRVGNDATKTIANAIEFGVQVECTNTVAVSIAGLYSGGGNDLDCGTGLSYQYRYRARDSQTGAASNFSPAMRYAIAPRRSGGVIAMPAAYADPQADTFDVERIGGALEDWTYVGSVAIGNNNIGPSAATIFFDNYGDEAVATNDVLPEDNYEPFPSIGPPLSTTPTGATITGFVAQLQFATPGNASLTAILNLLPGNLLQVGQQVYTTYSRPTLVSSGGGFATYRVLLQENGGIVSAAQATILEPAIANQLLSRVWGPDDNGCLFGVGDTLRPGGVYNTNPQNPDGCNEGVNFVELCPPTEPLINGALIQQTSCVASTQRWWAGRAGQDQAGNLKYNYTEIPVGRGLAAAFGICSDGDTIYFVGPDGIYAHSGGPAESLTDADLYPLFPHEGLLPGSAPINIAYAGNVTFAPNYKNTEKFRLSVVNRFLYFDYVDSGGIFHTLVCDLRTKAWSVDSINVGGGHLSLHAGTTTQVGSGGTAVAQLYAGDSVGALWTQNVGSTPNTETVPVVICTREETGGDLRALKEFGDGMTDLLPRTTVTVTPILLGAANGGLATTVGIAATRQAGVVLDLGGEVLGQTLGLRFTWSETIDPTVLYAWQLSWVMQPETTGRRVTDWEGAADGSNQFYQGFSLEADTANAIKAVTVRDADTLATHAFNGPTGLVSQVQHNGQSRLTYSFVTPFSAHLVRLEPTDAVAWRVFGLDWIRKPTPSGALNWYTQPTSYGLPGYHQVHHAVFAYAATATVTLTITTDGTPVTYTLPSTGGAYKKVVVMFAAVKGLVDSWSAVSSAKLAVWIDDIEVYVKAWGDPGEYRNARLVGGRMEALADV